MSRTVVDSVILGQGLAGTVLAWQLHWRGDAVLLVDENLPGTASRIAAGLMTPITGQRLVPSWRFAEFWPAAVSFYRQVEKTLGQEVFREVPMLRLFKTEQERQRIEQSAGREISGLVRFPKPLVEPADFHADQGGFEMTGGQLQVSQFLSASREFFESRGQLLTARLSLPDDVLLNAEGIELPRWNVQTKRLVFCQGFAARENPWFKDMPFDPAKGEIVTVRVPGLEEQRILHRGIWLAPLGNQLFRVGATYDRDHLDNIPTPQGRSDLCEQLQHFLKRSFEVVEHQAAVRPIVLGRHPVAGRHPRFSQLACFNGLGSKGSLQAPFIAGQLAAYLHDAGTLEDVFNIQKRFPNLDKSD